MPHDAIVGAVYQDDRYDCECQVVAVRSVADSRLPDPDEIEVELYYEELDTTQTVLLDGFRNIESITLVSIPDR